MFTKTAKHYDAVYSGKDYEAESELLTALIRERVPGAESLLDVACGTGRHLEHLDRQFDCTGLDLDDEMLAIARERVPTVKYHTGNMCDFNLDTGFDVVTCLFSSIGYTKTVVRLEQAISNMAAHVNPGGVLVIEPWITPESWLVGMVSSSTVETEDFVVTRMTVAEPVERGRVVLEYMIGESGGINRVTETHEMGWFTNEEYLSGFEKAGLNREHLELESFGRGLYIGRK
ncbi:MAG: class I SAM-dependent methyltransferase [Dehalococcoidia bacterium]|jgi:ubiquinone/menaquinone biosynthesis C-methylase UbiE|nr:class I SAM-dependent methyltransferase [Dehalococcoidia bacterium]